MAIQQKQYTFQIQIMDGSNNSLANIKITPVIFKKERIGETFTNKKGIGRLSFFSNNFDKQYRGKGVITTFYVYDDKKLIGAFRQELHFKKNGGYDIKLDFVLDVKVKDKSFSINILTKNNKDGHVLPHLDIEALYVQPEKENILLQKSITDETGKALINFRSDLKLIGDKKGYLFLRVSKEGQLIYDSLAEEKYWRFISDVLNITLLLPEFEDNDFSKRVVCGVLRDEFGVPIPNSVVQAFDKDLRNEELLGTVSTNKEGYYEIKYNSRQFKRAEKDFADLIIKVRKSKRHKAFLHQTSVLFNAPVRAEININLSGKEYKGASEFELMTNCITPLLDKLSPLDLREDDEFQDGSFLAGETGYSLIKIGNWIAAHRMAVRTKLEAVVFFAFLRQGQPGIAYDNLLADIKFPERITLLEEKMLKATANLTPELQRDLIEKAIDKNYIPAKLSLEIDNILGVLNQMHLDFISQNTLGAGKGTIGELLELTQTTPKQNTVFIRHLNEHSGSMANYWQNLQEKDVFKEEVIEELRTTFELGALTFNHIPLVKQLKNSINKGDVKDIRALARYSKEDWIRLLSQETKQVKAIGTPKNRAGKTEIDRIDYYANELILRLERTFPTTAFSANLSRAVDTSITQQKEIADFLDNSPDFDLRRIRIDHYLAANPNSIKDAVVKKELKTVQRVFKLSPTYASVDTLMKKKIHSAQQVYFKGKDQFIGELSDLGIGKSELSKIYAKSEIIYTLALDYYGNYNSGMTGVTPTSIPTATPDAAQAKKVEQLPNLQTLFGSADYCECEHCRSVYSPAAYYVDILRFISERVTNKPTLHDGPPLTDIFFARRPDLGELELSCKNTNTPLPYIDLVNEILEDAVANPDPVASIAIGLKQYLPTAEAHKPLDSSIMIALGLENIQVEEGAIAHREDIRNQWGIRDSKQAFRVVENGTKLDVYITRQTFWSAAELRANPEYTNQKAYDTNHLGGAVFPFNLPFNLWNIQSRAYLKYLGVEQHELFELFQQGGTTPTPSSIEINSAYFGMTNVERTIITNTSAIHDSWDYWGLNETVNNVPNPTTPTDNTTNYTGGWIDVLCHVPILLHRSKLNYRELLQIVDLPFINPTGLIAVNTLIDTNTASCDSSTFKVENLSQGALTRINQFVRLWRKLDIEMWELDILIRDLGANQITDTFISELALIQKIKSLFKLDWVTTLSLTKDIDSSIYVNRAKSGFPEIQNLYQRLYRNNLVDAVSIFPDDPSDLSSLNFEDATIPGILAASKLTESELDLIVADIGILVGDMLNLSILSTIYRYSTLSKALKISVKEFIDLKSMSGIDPFLTLVDTWKFVQLTNKIASSDFSIDELNYLLNHIFTPGEGININDEAIEELLFEVRDGLQKLDDDLSIKLEESPTDYISNKLGLMPSLDTDEKQQTALAILMGTWEGVESDRNTFLDENLSAIFSDLAATKILLTTSIYVNSSIPPPVIPTPPEVIDIALKSWFNDEVQPALQIYLLNILKENWIIQQLSDAFDLDLNKAEKLLTGIELNVGVTILEEIIANLNAPDILAKNTDGEYINELNELNYGSIFSIIKVLHKNALVITKLGIESNEIIWLLNNANVNLNGGLQAELNWINPKDYPLTTGSNIPLERWEKMYDFFDWKKQLKSSDISAIDFMSIVLDTASTDIIIKSSLSLITKAELTDINDLISAFAWTGPLATNLYDSKNLLRIYDCLNAASRLGVKTQRAIDWATANPNQLIASSLKQTVKAKYELSQWQEVIQPLQDKFREAKRDALVSWLIANPNAALNQFWIDENGLFSYYLIDVETSACMLTSRIKQASAAVQFFVQRCLLNIENEVLATGSIWKRWEWMKYYRLWEANRKVFLYPENWIEPELRDEKTPFFKELESELMQDDITKDSVERAYLNYLEKLDKVANLEIRAMYTHELGNCKKELYVFGRTRSSVGAEYFWRKRTKEELWTAWQKIDLKIDSDQLIPAIHNERLYLFWPQFIEKAEEPDKVKVPTQGESEFILEKPVKYNEVRLFWSEFTKQGKWTPGVLSDKHMVVYTTSPKNEINFRVRHLPEVFIKTYFVRYPTINAPESVQGLSKIGKQLSVQTDLNNIERIVAPPKSYYHGGLLLNDSSKYYYFYYNSIYSLSNESAHHNALSISVLKNLQSPTFSVIDSQASFFEPKGSFFFWDDRKNYFVDYDYSTYSTYDYDYPNIINQHIKRDFRFYINYHPFVELFIKELNTKGLKGVLNRDIQVAPELISGIPTFDFNDYLPNPQTVSQPFPEEEVDFEYRGPYAPYNWELFFHVPFFIANNLSNNQRFAEALEWYNYIFDPTNSDTNTSNPDTPQQKFWITKPFYETTKADYYKQKIENLLLLIAQGQADLTQIEGWRDNPFNPHLVARMRTVAYQKNVLIKYIKTIIAWGDQLYRRETMETVSEATQLYILASEILGPKPKSIPRQIPNPYKTYYQLKKEGIGAFGNVLMDIENILPNPTISASSNGDNPELPRLNLLYFCVPHNDVLLQLWDLVAGRLYNIRHCLNIEGLVLELPLFEPPIDPGAVVAAAAGGGGFGSALGDLNAPLPHYRFRFMVQKALELCSEVKNLGGALLSALEKKDAEEMALLRSNNETVLLDSVKSVREKQIQEASLSWASLKESKKLIEHRKNYYSNLVNDKLLPEEKTAIGLTISSLSISAGTVLGYGLAAILRIIPEFKAGASGAGGTPVVTAEAGGDSIASAGELALTGLSALASSLDKGAGLASTIANNKRREEDWKYQKELAEKELPQIETQIEIASVRLQIAEKELSNHEIQIENRSKEDEFMQSKYTNKELYSWMTGQISTLYFQSYQLAYDIAKKAERCMRYELGLSTSNYIQFGYWDSLHKGLLSGEKLQYDLKRMEMAYYEQNRRDYELTKHISLAQIDPVSLLKLRQTGECFVEISELIFNMDYPGHYFRRIKSVSVSIPCIAGPYTTIACTLTMMSNSIRKDANSNSGYERDLTTDDIRFKDEITGTQSIATSSAKNDSGVFNLSFQDERYVPFEGAGVISKWHLKLNTEFRQFDYNTITDVILHMSYTAKEGGELLATSATDALVNHLKNAAADPDGNLYHVFDVKRTFGNEFHKFLNPANPGDEQVLVLDKIVKYLPFFTKSFNTKELIQMEVVAKMKTDSDYSITITPTVATDANIGTSAKYGGLHNVLFTTLSEDLNQAFNLKIKIDGAVDYTSLPSDEVEELFLIINYKIEDI